MFRRFDCLKIEFDYCIEIDKIWLKSLNFFPMGGWVGGRVGGGGSTDTLFPPPPPNKKILYETLQAVAIQRAVKGWLARRAYQRALRRVVRVQCCVRVWASKRRLKELRVSVCQCVCQGFPKSCSHFCQIFPNTADIKASCIICTYM